jgi:hypothetical protein
MKKYPFQLKLVTAPSETAVTVAEAKEYLRIDNNLEDLRVQLMIESATSVLENYLSLKFITQVWDIFFDQFPSTMKNDWWDGSRDISISELVTPDQNIFFPLGIAQSFDQFSTYSDDEEFAEDKTRYSFDSVGGRTRVGLKLGGVWPQTILRSNNGIRFRFTFGFGNKAAVPSEIRMAILEFVAHIYENRGDQNEMKIPPHILTMIEHHRRQKLVG